MGLMKGIRKPVVGRFHSPHKSKSMNYSAMSNGTGDTEAINSQEDSFDEKKFFAALVETDVQLDEETPAEAVAAAEIQRDADGFPILPSGNAVVAFQEGTTSQEVSPLKTVLQEADEVAFPTFLNEDSAEEEDEDPFFKANLFSAPQKAKPKILAKPKITTRVVPEASDSFDSPAVVVNEDNKKDKDWDAISHISGISQHSEVDTSQEETNSSSSSKPEPEPKTTKTIHNDNKSKVKSMAKSFNTGGGSKVRNMAAAFEGAKTTTPSAPIKTSAPVRTFRRSTFTPPASTTAANVVSPESTTKNEFPIKLKPVNRSIHSNSIKSNSTNSSSSNNKESSIKNLIQNFNSGKPTTPINTNRVQVSSIPTKAAAASPVTKRTTHLFKTFDENKKVVNRYVSFSNIDNKPVNFHEIQDDIDLVVSVSDSSADSQTSPIAARYLASVQAPAAEVSTSTDSNTSSDSSGVEASMDDLANANKSPADGDLPSFDGSTATALTNNTTATKSPSVFTTKAIQHQFTSLEEAIRLSCETFNNEKSPDTSFDSTLTAPSACSASSSVFSSPFELTNTFSRQFADSLKQIKREFNEFRDDHAAMFKSAAAQAEKNLESFLAEPTPRKQR